MGGKYTDVPRGTKFGDGWSFAIVNGRLAEISFKPRHGIFGHAYVKRSEFKTKGEQKMINVDTKKFRFTYRNGFYYDQIRRTKQRAPSREEVFPESDYQKAMSLEKLKELLKLDHAKKKKSKKT